MIRVAAITSSRDDPSSRWRVRQMIAPLRDLGVDAVEYRPWISKYASVPLQLTGLGLVSRAWAGVAARGFDVTWLNRELVTGRRTFERCMGKTRVFEVDDAIWMGGRGDFARRIAAECAGVIAGNVRIADYFRDSTRRVWVVPTAIDAARWVPSDVPPSEFVVGWSGTHWNLPYLYPIEADLATFLSGHPRARLRIVCDRPPAFRQIPPDRVEYLRWSPENEVGSVQSMSVGLMPLPDTEWTRAKCATKMLSYLSCGVPVVVSPVGSAGEVLERGNVGVGVRGGEGWVEPLAAFHDDPARARAMGLAGREVVRAHYSVTMAARQLADIFVDVAGSRLT